MSVPKNFGAIFGNKAICNNNYWIPVVQGSALNSDEDGNYFWLDDRLHSNKTPINDPKWRKSEPNGLLSEKCVEITLISGKYYWNDQTCIELRCSICRLPAVQTYYLRGQSLFDNKYLLILELQENPLKIRFEGTKNSWYYWYPLEDKTKLLDIRYNSTLTSKKNPFGKIKMENSETWEWEWTFQWIFTNVSTKLSIFFFFMSQNR